MKSRCVLLALTAVAVVCRPAGADDPPPAKKEAPEGWVSIQPKDFPYRSLLPAKNTGNQTGSRTSAVNGLKTTVREQTVKTKDGLEFQVNAMHIVGKGASAIKRKDVIRDFMRETEDTFDADATETKSVKVNGMPGREFVYTKDGEVVRGRVVSAANWVFEVNVKGKDKAAVTSKEIDAYLDSIEYVPPPKKAAEPKKAEPAKEPTKDN